RFDCGWKTGGLFKLYLVNSLGVIFSAGLLSPWAAVRTARYQLKRISLRPSRGIGAFLAAAQEQVGAVGDAASDMLGFDFGLCRSYGRSTTTERGDSSGKDWGDLG